MLDWNEIIGINKDMNYMGNVENGVVLPELGEEILFCRPSYRDDTQDIYFSGHIFESKYGLELTNSSIGGTEMVIDGIRWARFNKPETENNIGYDFVSVCKLANKVAAEVVQIQGAKLSKECFDKFKV